MHAVQIENDPVFLGNHLPGGLGIARFVLNNKAAGPERKDVGQ